jgi:hypothetical protein
MKKCLPFSKHTVLLLSLAFRFSTSFLQSSHKRGWKTTIESRRLASPERDNALSFQSSRRAWLVNSTSAALGLLALGDTTSFGMNANAQEQQQDDAEDFDAEFEELYDNPAIPKVPEERSGLTVLRVAEVAQFQEKILRAIASGELEGVQVAPMQFAFGTQILLRNSNLDGNMKLMIYQEIPKSKRSLSIKNAVNVMNTLQGIAKYAGAIQRDFKTEEMVELADMYRTVRINLNQLYEYLPEKEKEKYYGYFVAVTAYEKKIAEGTYNPDIDGILDFDD